MVIGNLLIGTIAGSLAYVCKVIYDSNRIELDPVVEVDNIVKYEYIPVGKWEHIEMELNKVKYTFIEGEKEGVKAFIGYDLEGNLKNFDMLEGHTIVGGASRWGKSSFLNVFITNITKTYTRNEVCFLGCDYKKADVYYFRNYNNFLGMSTNKEEFMAQIKWLEKEKSSSLLKS